MSPERCCDNVCIPFFLGSYPAMMHMAHRAVPSDAPASRLRHWPNLISFITGAPRCSLDHRHYCQRAQATRRALLTSCRFVLLLLLSVIGIVVDGDRSRYKSPWSVALQPAFPSLRNEAPYDIFHFQPRPSHLPVCCVPTSETGEPRGRLSQFSVAWFVLSLAPHALGAILGAQRSLGPGIPRSCWATAHQQHGGHEAS